MVASLVKKSRVWVVLQDERAGSYGAVCGSFNIPIAKSGELSRIAESLKTFGGLTEKSPANLPLKNI